MNDNGILTFFPASNQSITNSSFSNNERSTCEVNSNTTTNDLPPPPPPASATSTEATTAMVTSPASTTGSTSGGTGSGDQMKLNFFNSLKQRGFDTICLLNANDTDIFDFIQNFPHGATGIQSLILRCCNIRYVRRSNVLHF